MIKRVFSTLSVVILLGGVPSLHLSANTGTNFFGAPGLSPSIDYGDNIVLTWVDKISTKRGEEYDASKDPALRKGTENWEGPQGSFFIIPAAVVGLIAIVLFFNRE